MALAALSKITFWLYCMKTRAISGFREREATVLSDSNEIFEALRCDQ